jgi:hypothetical protein
MPSEVLDFGKYTVAVSTPPRREIVISHDEADKGEGGEQKCTGRMWASRLSGRRHRMRRRAEPTNPKMWGSRSRKLIGLSDLVPESIN